MTERQIILSIVSVTFRDHVGLRRTLESVVPLTQHAQVELIVVDGSAEEQTRDWVGGLPGIKLVSEPDEGIYDAMNKGARLARGSHIWFLNGGDLADLDAVRPEDLVRRLVDSTDSVHMFGYGIASGAGVTWRRARSQRYLRHALPTSHQAMFFPTVAFRNVGGYDLTYRVAADYYIAARLYVDGVQFVQHPEPIARFEVGGLSTQHAAQIAVDARRVQEEVLMIGRLERTASNWRHGISRWYRSVRFRTGNV